MIKYRVVLLVGAAVILMLPNVDILQAQESNEELAKAVQNPLANMISFPFQNNTNFGYQLGGEDRTQNVLNIQPVIPLKGGRIITRTIIPLVWQPVPATNFATLEPNVDFGVSDISFTAFYSPEPKGAIWGVGPILTIPTGYTYSSGKWGIGPSFVVLMMKAEKVYGFLINNVWSFAGDDQRPDVNQMLFQPFLNINFSGGKYIGIIPIITANWEAPSGQQWTVPLGVSVGKIVRAGKLPINLQAGAYVNVVKPDIGPDWQLRLQAQLLLPASILTGDKK